MERCVQSSISVFLVFALGIWTLRYEPLVSGSFCSFLVRQRIHVLRFQDGFWKYFMIFYVIGWTRLLRSILLC